MIIDCHLHVGWKGYSADDVVRHLDNIGVDKAWIHSWQEMDGGLGAYYEHLEPEHVMAAAKRYPDRLIPFCAVDPRRETAEELTRKFVKQGCRGYGEHKVRIMLDNPESIRMYKLVGELGLPVLLHIDVALQGVPFWYGGNIDALERAALKCPKTTFIGHGPGFWREITAGADRSKQVYPKGKVKPGGKLPKILARNRNIYADLSAGSGLNAMKRDVKHAKRFLRKFHRKVLYGTDWFDRKHLDFLEGLGLEKKVFETITWRNAARLVKI